MLFGRTGDLLSSLSWRRLLGHLAGLGCASGFVAERLTSSLLLFDSLISVLLLLDFQGTRDALGWIFRCVAAVMMMYVIA